MAIFWKQFVEWVIGSKHKPFETARLRLTLFYIFVIAIILAVFSLFLFYSLSNNIRDDLETDIAANQVQANKIDSAIDHLEFNIFGMDFVVLLLTASLGFVLAGKTLGPVREALDAQAQFTADASHEFRTPLAVMRYEIDIALNNKHLGITDAKKVMQSNIEEIDYISNIVERLLMLARCENDWNNTDMSELELSSLMRTVVSRMENLANKKQITINLSEIQPARIMGNIQALEEMVFNILQNSIDYTNPGGAITVSLKPVGKFYELIVKDTGIGIEAKDLPHVFKRFYKSDRARSIKHGGGLGLSIVQGIAKEHKAEIQIQSIVDKGTIVHVFFPHI